MNELMVDDPCIVFALERESQSFRREFRPQERFLEAPCWARFCGPAWLTVLVLHSGIGKDRMAKTGEWLLQSPVFGNLPYRPKAVLMAGYAGALQDGFKVGDIILATEIVGQSGHSWPATWPERPLEGEWRPPIQRGRILTEEKLISQPAEKRDLGKRHDAVAVDMESAVLAKLCAARGVPFGCVRVISDSVDTVLSPQLVSLMSTGRISIWRTILAVLRRPALAGELRRLAKHTRYASEQLGKGLGELLTLTLPWSEELESGQ